MEWKGELFCPRHNNIVVETPEVLRMHTKDLTNLSFCAVSFNRRATSFKGNSEAEVTEVVRNSKNRTLRKAEDRTSVKKPPILPWIVEPAVGVQ
ncbi:MAG: hypothetical protein A2428_04810 [Bdellovibrionales bacterium RIFOXYC1_FULL_54_43]|nr:MAG: hypothetical protein A2428_04810 [Bdellovibrionales bacterium RIFOXYC1_FULL_54_43]OFZ83911.1 MAG: hypothetical protein A2603_09180 [Bdellovibrionales bacterium RIFOXYD1_FULL_55_31]